MSNPPSNPFKPGQPGASAPSRPPTGAFVPGSEVLAELVQGQRQVSQLTQELVDLRSKLGRRSHQMAVLQHVAEILAATPKVAQVAGVLQDVFVQEFGAKTCAIWIMEDGGAAFQAKTAHGVSRSALNRMQLPSPNPFPNSPIVLFQDQWLEPSLMPQCLDALRPDGQNLFFVPFEHQLLLLGFAVLGLDPGRKMDEDQETLTILQRQVAVTIYNAWLFRDLGEQRDALRHKTTELEKANDALREADRFKSEFLALTSHELRTPLTGILGFTRLVMDGLYEDEEEMQRMLGDSYASGQHLLNLLNDILDLAKIESGRMQTHIEPFSLYVLMEEVKPIAMAYPRKPEVELLWPESLKEIPDVMIDAGRLKQVLLNLISNALKFTKEGCVRVTAERGFGQVVMQVIDTGIGIPVEVQGRLFQKFVQADGGHAREFGGSGLGLVICKHLLEMMGGSIRLQSEGAGKGTTMTLTVPIV